MSVLETFTYLKTLIARLKQYSSFRKHKLFDLNYSLKSTSVFEKFATEKARVFFE